MSNGNSKLPPNSGMSDERWLTVSQRNAFVDTTCNMLELAARTHDLASHAEAADELIAELAEALRAWRAWWNHEQMNPDMKETSAALARVDALTKDTA